MRLGKQTVTVVGGDKRSFLLAEMLAEENIDVTVYGFDEVVPQCYHAKTLMEAVEASKILIGPLPFANKTGKLNTSMYHGEISIEEIFTRLKKDQVFLGGHIDERWIALAVQQQIKLIDYFNREELQVLNAIPTAEGAIQIAMEKLEQTIHGTNVMVLGFGRIGKTLAKSLVGLGANVHVVARKHADIAWIKSYQCKPVYVTDMEERLSHMDLIINTVPAIVLKKLQLEKVKKNCLIIDVASDPGGIDVMAAEQLKIEVIRALGLPGKVAPVSAAKCIKETIDHLMKELEM